jgi:hypothetical protein
MCPISDFWSSIHKEDGHVHSKLQISMWQIHTPNGNVKEVFGESLDLIALNFNEGTNQEFSLQVTCLVTNAINYNVLIGQEALFPPGFTIDN